MRVGGVPAHGDHRRGLGFQAAGAELFQDPGLHLPLGERPARAQLGAEALPNPGHDRIQVHRRGLVAAGALFVQDPRKRWIRAWEERRAKPHSSSSRAVPWSR